MINLRKDLKDFELVRLMFWYDAIKPIPKKDFLILKLLRKHGILIEEHEELIIAGYPNLYEKDDFTWICINKEALECKKK